MKKLVEAQKNLIVEEQDKITPSLSIEIPAHQTYMEALSYFEVLKKSLQYYKAQNGYLNDSNNQLMLANRRLREYLEETNSNYQGLIAYSKEVLRRKKLTQQQNEELIKQNK